MDLQFGDFRLRPRERQLVGPAGPVDLSARSFDILQALLARPNEVIGKEALLEAAWPGLVVEENTLQVHVSALRKLFGPDLIATVHGRGYKYAGPAPVSVSADTTVAAEPPHTAHRPVIVVLPFDNLSGDPEQQYFSDGITGDIIDRLSRFRVFPVIGQHSAAAFRSLVPDFSAIRERLKANYVVAGSLRRTPDRLRLSVRLSDAASEETIWAERYDRPATDLFMLQDEISGLVATTVARHLEVEINVRNSAKPPASLSSHEYLLRGCWHFRKLTRDSNLASRECFNRALELDPRNAEALAWLGVTYSENWVEDFGLQNALIGVEKTARAMDIDPFNARVHVAHCWALLCNGDRDAAVRTASRGMTFNDGDPNVMANYSLALTYDGQLDEARKLHAEMRRLEPLPPLWFAEFEGIAAFVEGDYEKCLAGVEPIEEAAWDNMYALASYGLTGQAAKARNLLARLREQNRSPDWAIGLSHEAYRNPEVRERLAQGLERALSF